MKSWAVLMALALMIAGAGAARAQNPVTDTPEAMRMHFASLNKRILDMARDFPEDKFDYRPRPEMRTFRELMVHIAGGNVYATKAGRGKKVNWDELDAKDYATKAAVVALMEKSVADAEGVLKRVPDVSLEMNIEPWIGVLEQSAEHYGLLVGYYRANGLVPPASRPAK